ncbi:MAG: insulinase family protein, partial [Ignavibacteria bacterium]|nr:insulinase family protein [Ignavibacteria bacterium]
LAVFVSGTVHAQVPDRKSPPALGPTPLLRLPAIQRFQLSNGLPVVIMEKHNVPVVQVNLLVNAGSAMDANNKSGLASLTVDMMDEGAGQRDALELADAIDFLGASIRTNAGMHTSSITLHTPLGKIDEALPLMADIAMRPTFPATELGRKQKERLTTLLQWHDEPRAIASVLFNRTLFGAQHPYGIPTLGSERSIHAFVVDDLRKFHSLFFHAGNATIVVVGDVVPQTILPKFEAAFGSWGRKPASKASWTRPKQVRQRQIYLVDKPEAAQSEIRIGRIGAERLTEDYFPLVVMNTILGGSFTSRLNQNLREQHGYTYGAGSSFDFRLLPGPFLAGSAVQSAVTDKALTEFMNELTRILQPSSDEELTRAKNYLALRYPRSFQTASQIAGELGEVVTYSLPDDYFNTYVQRVLSVTKEDVVRVAKKYLDPEAVAIIIVGDRKVIEKGLRDLNLGPVNNLSIEDVLGKPPVVESKN